MGTGCLYGCMKSIVSKWEQLRTQAAPALCLMSMADRLIGYEPQLSMEAVNADLRLTEWSQAAA